MRSFASGLVLALVLAAAAATGAPLVYHSPGDTGHAPGPPAGAPYLPKASSVTLYLWLDPGPTAPSGGETCVDAAGHASCAYDVRIRVQGDSQLTGFSPIGSDVVFDLTPTMLRANRIMKNSPLVGPTKIGQLVVNTLGPQGGLIEVAGVNNVGAALQVEGLPNHTLAYVPEPDQLVLLFAGLAGLAVLHRLRGAR
jgi:hypothetical protein